MASTKINLPSAFSSLFHPEYRYQAFFGGRGSAKSHSCATALSILGTQRPIRVLCAREIQKSIKDSVKRLIEDKINECGLQSFYKITETQIEGSNGTLFLFSGLKTNPDSIKSMEGIDIAWVEEANRVSQRSLDLLIPTIRKEGSQIWFTWNPETEYDPVDIMFRGHVVPPNSFIKRVSFDDNPWFPEVLRVEMEHDKMYNYPKYEHVWLGEYQKSTEGSYYAKHIEKAREDGRITSVPYTAGVLVDTYWDLGIADAMSIWFVQTVGKEIRIIDYYEQQGEGFTHFKNVLSSKGYTYGRHFAPHDIEVRELSDGKSRREKAQALGIHFETVSNIPIIDGINAARDILSQCWFDLEKCREGLRALRHYQKEYDENRQCYKKHPLHDWSSHAADAFRYFAVGFQNHHQPAPKISIAFDAYGRPSAVSNESQAAYL